MPVVELCRREGIHPTIYYKWLKDFMEAGKCRLRGESKREATAEEVLGARDTIVATFLRLHEKTTRKESA